MVSDTTIKELGVMVMAMVAIFPRGCHRIGDYKLRLRKESIILWWIEKSGFSNVK